MQNYFSLLGLLAFGCAQTTVTAQPAGPAQDLKAAIGQYRQRQASASPENVFDWLKAGNDRFQRGASTHGGFPVDTRSRMAVSAAGQRPLAVVLSCVDARTTPELVFDTSVGDLFTVRVGANVVNDDVLGSLEIAVESGARVLVVLGHTDCGGVKGACSHLQLGHMTQLLERVKPAIATTNALLDHDLVLSSLVGARVVTNPRYIAEVSHQNAEQSARQILERSPLLRAKVLNHEILLVSGIYDVNTGKVNFSQQRKLQH